MTINKEKFNSYKNLKGIIMANHASAKKRIRRNTRMENVNKIRKNRVRSFIKKVEVALAIHFFSIIKLHLESV